MNYKAHFQSGYKGKIISACVEQLNKEFERQFEKMEPCKVEELARREAQIFLEEEFKGEQFASLWEPKDFIIIVEGYKEEEDEPIEAPEPELPNWYFTFGFGQAYPGGYVKIKGTSQEARQEMMDRYGTKWSMQYSEEKFFPQIKRFNLYEVENTDV